MRFGMIGEGFMERLVLRSRLFPAPMLESYAMVTTRALLAATERGLFEALVAGPATASEVAERCETDPTATEKLLNLLVGMRHLRVGRDGRYALTSRARRWLTGSGSLRDSILMKDLEWRWIERLDEFLVSGTHHDVHGTMAPADWGRYQRGMRSNAGVVAPLLASRIPIPTGARDLLDIGGSHGFFSVALCRRHEGLRAVVLDLPDAVEHAAPLLAAEGMGERVTLRAGDALTDDLGTEAYDAVFMASLVHHFDDASNRSLVRRAADALRPGGTLVIFDAIRLDPWENDQVSAFFDLYFAMTSRAGLWTYEEMAEWQRAAGLRPRPPIRLPMSRANGLQVADKPA
ncbi:MAG TPA: class I SAM-dependent methyltransferase [Candidatus Angelobacter sp.]|nr:class I SAM-dependent methyltransferase [Candidatus Angelobacter sp.]